MTTQPQNHEQGRILARVRKMLNLANDTGATEGERDNALRMAHATLAKYNLELSEVGSTETSKTAAGEAREEVTSSFLGKPWSRTIANAVADLFFCHYLVGSDRANMHNAYHYFIGRHSNAITAQELSKYLVQSVHREAKRYAAAQGRGYQVYRSFCYAAAAHIRNRCHQLRTVASSPTPAAKVDCGSTQGMSLAVVYNNEEEANRQFVAVRYGELTAKVGRPIKSLASDAAYAAGAAYGDTVSLNRQVK